MKVKNQKLKVKKEETKINEEAELLKSQLVRTLADYDNLVKRVEREREELGKYASLTVVSKLLPVLDNLERAQMHLQDSGLAIAIGELINVLKDEGLSVIEPQPGDDFDEQEMEVTETVPGGKPGTIAEQVLPGWKYVDGKVVRVAKVKVYS